MVRDKMGIYTVLKKSPAQSNRTRSHLGQAQGRAAFEDVISGQSVAVPYDE